MFHMHPPQINPLLFRTVAEKVHPPRAQQAWAGTAAGAWAGTAAGRGGYRRGQGLVPPRV